MNVMRHIVLPLIVAAITLAGLRSATAQQVPPGLQPVPKWNGNPVSAVRHLSGDRTLQIYQRSPLEIPEVTWWGAQSCDTIHVHGIYSDWTVDVLWNPGDAEPNVQIQYLPPPPGK